MEKKVDTLIIGTGPAGLIAADIISAAGKTVQLWDRRGAPGWKILVAGSSGLNVSYEAADQEFASFYPERSQELARCFREFPPSAWLDYLRSLGEEPYLGTSRRYFLRSWKGASLLKNWMGRLEAQGVALFFQQELAAIQSCVSEGLIVTFKSGLEVQAKTVLLALGGASWENETPSWVKVLAPLNIEMRPFTAANVGYHLRAPEEFFAKAAGLAIKGLILKTARGSKQGELMITNYGLEGTPIYTVGSSGAALLDLKPELSEERLEKRLAAHSGSALARIRAVAKLSPGAFALVESLGGEIGIDSANPKACAALLKNFPIELLQPRPLAEAISSRGGLAMSELTEGLEAKKIANLYFAGEMLDWDAPTGGFLLTAAAATGAVAAKSVLRRLG